MEGHRQIGQESLEEWAMDRSKLIVLVIIINILINLATIHSHTYKQILNQLCMKLLEFYTVRVSWQCDKNAI